MRLAILTSLLFLAAAVTSPVAASALGRPRGRVEALACAPSNADVAAAIVGDTVWITRDGGTTWRKLRRLDPLLAVAPEEPLDEASTDDGSEEPAEAEAPTTAPYVLAVGDGGEWAAARGGSWVVELGDGIAAHADRGDDVSGLAFDSASRLWVAAGDRLVVIERGRAPRIVASPGKGAPVPQEKTGEILLAGARGIAALSVGAGGDVAARAVGPAAEAVAVDAIDGAVYAVRQGAISRVDGEGEASFAARAPFAASRLVVGGRAFHVLAGGRWHASETSGGPRPLSARAIAADARGRLWLGAEDGPVAPEKPVAAAPVFAPPRAPETVADFARRPPPPCPRPAAALLPDAQLSFGFGLRELATATVDGATDTAGSRSWLAVGLTFTWELEPAVDAKCEARKERFQEREGDRLARHVELRAELTRAFAAQAAARTIADALVAAIAVEAISAQLVVVGGRASEEEEERK